MTDLGRSYSLVNDKPNINTEKDLKLLIKLLPLDCL
jgi:hypothetical protein